MASPHNQRLASSALFHSAYSNFLFIFPAEIPKKALLQKISQLRLERQAAKAHTDSMERLNTSMYPTNEPHETNGNIQQQQQLTKRQLILDTIEDLKRSLEDQSVELCGLNEDE